MNSGTTPVLAAHGLTKLYSGVPALNGVDFSLYPGEVHALLGENGAGKTTLVKLLSGILQPNRGSMTLSKSPLRLRGPRDALQHGISTVHQELSCAPYLPVFQNLWLGHEPTYGSGLVSFTRLRALSAKLCAEYGVDIDLDRWVGDLPLAEQQTVEIIKALSWSPRVLILDEPTSALTAQRTSWLLDLVRRLKETGMAVLFISHRLAEVMQLADRITVLKDGALVGTRKRSEVNEADLVNMMVGRELADIFPPKPDPLILRGAPQLLKVNGFSCGRLLRDVGFNLRQGEILGVAGLEGQGQHELMLALFGMLPLERGRLTLRGREIAVRNPGRAIKSGLSLVPADRRIEGLVMPLSIRENLALPTLPRRSRFGFVARRHEDSVTKRAARDLAIKADRLDAPVRTLSGGNQQKVVLGKWLLSDPSVLLLDDPTRGVDVETRREIYHRLRQLAASGKGILLRSTDTMELIGLCDTVLVMYEGAVVAVLQGTEITEENIVGNAMGLNHKERDALV